MGLHYKYKFLFKCWLYCGSSQMEVDVADEKRHCNTLKRYSPFHHLHTTHRCNVAIWSDRAFCLSDNLIFFCPFNWPLTSSVFCLSLCFFTVPLEPAVHELFRSVCLQTDHSHTPHTHTHTHTHTYTHTHTHNTHTLEPRVWQRGLYLDKGCQ